MPLLTEVARTVRGGVVTAIPLVWAWRAALSLRAIRNNTRKIKKTDVLVVCRLIGAGSPGDHFLDHYRRLGVSHFLVLGDRSSVVGLRQWAAQCHDVSVFAARRPATAHVNRLLRRYGTGHLCVIVDCDEFLVYPFMDTRSLRALGQFLRDDRRVSMSAIVLDMYGCDDAGTAGSPAEGDPFARHPYFDRDGYVQFRGWGRSTRISGGPLLRLDRSDPKTAPGLDRIAVVWWRWFYSFHDARTARPWRLNLPHKPGHISTTGALLRVGRTPPAAYEPGISERYASWSQLVQLGLVSAGNWF